MLSIGTGNPGFKEFEDSFVKFLGQTVVGIATETEGGGDGGDIHSEIGESTTTKIGTSGLMSIKVCRALIGLDEYKQKGAMESATERYLIHQARKNRVRDCIQNMRLKQSVYIEDYS